MMACCHRLGLTWSTDTTFPTSLNQYDSGLRTLTCSIPQRKAQTSSAPTAYPTLVAGQALPRLPPTRERLSKHDAWEPGTETQQPVQRRPAQHGRHVQEAARALRDCELQSKGSGAHSSSALGANGGLALWLALRCLCSPGLGLLPLNSLLSLGCQPEPISSM